MVSFEQFIGEAVSAFSAVNVDASKLSHWDIACQLTKQYGGNALNAAGASALTGQLTWARASMSPEWMEVYNSQRFNTIDPFLDSLVVGKPEFKLESATLLRSEAENELAFTLNHELRNYGYYSLFSTCYGDKGRSDRTLIVHCSELSLKELDAEIGLDRIRLLQAIIAANIHSPCAGYNDGVELQRRLSPREREILLWLASGYRNDEIAYKLNIAEVTIRKHITAARIKLNARTREQAVANAIRDNQIIL
ncbi:LuxR C-terminal-related transcriptional regulator [Ahrensia kielensis]|uniref:LuxR C-terminal-related transcriptional regulator n=1 Tax=Ahrensia kielensis TaxID=76980 RepID=A0ABU9T3L1_9HYPH